jgi:hypothetical protein
MDINQWPWMQEHSEDFQLECNPRIKGCSHNKTSQKECQMGLKNNQD